MKIDKLSKKELELLSNGDLTEIILKEKGKPMNTPMIFKKICEIHGYSEEEYTAKIGDYYTSLTTDKRFILLDSAKWDLRDNHSVKISIDDIDEEERIEEVEDIPEEVEKEEAPESTILDNVMSEEELDVDDDATDDIEDLAIVDEDDIDA